ncbi:MAG: efflux RND transporter periplasmic adaptor subunit [Acidobacteria bacterium]|nr:efflux RND transporter periplasmic adaptor subunit [Acidobacteriota bacterium]
MLRIPPRRPDCVGPVRLVCLLSLLAVVAAGCGDAAPAGEAGGPPGGAFPPMPVQMLTLTASEVPNTSEYVATIRSLRSTTVQPQVEGLVRELFVRAGDTVRQGDPLLRIDEDRQRATVAATESQIAARESDLVLARQQRTRAERLVEAGAVSQAELERTEAAVRSAESQLAALRSQVEEGQVELRYYRVTAPASGTIGDLAVRVGDRVTPTTEITTIDQAGGLEAYVHIPLERAAALQPGLMVELLDADGEVVSASPITFVDSRADDATQTVLVKATITGPPSSLRVMQYARARVVWSREPRLTIPVVAVTRISGQFFAFTAQPADGGLVARQTPISVGAVVGNDYVVEGGLDAGARVIVSNIQKLGDGVPVTAAE